MKKNLGILAIVLLALGLVYGVYEWDKARHDAHIRSQYGESVYMELHELAQLIQDVDSSLVLPSGELLEEYNFAKKAYNEAMDFWRFDLEENLPPGHTQTFPRRF